MVAPTLPPHNASRSMLSTRVLEIRACLPGNREACRYGSPDISTSKEVIKLNLMVVRNLAKLLETTASYVAETSFFCDTRAYFNWNLTLSSTITSHKHGLFLSTTHPSSMYHLEWPLQSSEHTDNGHTKTKDRTGGLESTSTSSSSCRSTAGGCGACCRAGCAARRGVGSRDAGH